MIESYVDAVENAADAGELLIIDEDFELYFTTNSDESSSPFNTGATETCVVEGCNAPSLFYSCFCQCHENAVEQIGIEIEIEKLFK